MFKRRSKLTAEDVFKAAPRPREEFKISDSVTVNLFGISTADHLKYVKFHESNKDNVMLVLAAIVSYGCEELYGSSPEEICDRLDSTILYTMANKVMTLSGFGTEKKS